MTKDFAKSRTQTDASKSRLPGWVWFVVGLSLGVFGSFIFYVSQVVPVDAEVAELLDQPKPNTSTARNKVEDLSGNFMRFSPSPSSQSSKSTAPMAPNIRRQPP